MPMDIRAVVLLSAIMPFILGMLMFLYTRLRKTYRGFGFWLLANFSFGLGYILLGLRNRIPDFFPIILGNALSLYGLVLIYDGIQLFFDYQAFDLGNHFIFGLYILIQLYLTYINPNVNARIVLISIVIGLIELRAGDALFRSTPHKLRKTCQTIAIIFFASALVSILRAGYAWSRSQPINILTDGTLSAYSFASICSITVWNFYFFFLNSARLELDLEQVQQDLSRIADADHHKVSQLALLEEASRHLAESLNETEIMQRAVEAVVNQFGYAEAAISLLVDADQLEVAAISGMEDIGYRPGFRQKIGDGIIGRTAETSRAYISRSVEDDPYYFSIGRRSGSAIGIPMMDERELLGVLYVESTTRDAFDQDDIQPLDTLMRHTVTAIQKARLYARAQAQLRAITTLQSASQTILSSLELQQIFQSVVQLLKDTFNYTYVSIYIMDGKMLRLGAQVGYPPDLIYYEISVTAGIAGRAVLTKQTQYLPNVSSDPDFLRAAYEIESEICVPLLKDDNVLGVLNVEAAPGHLLTENDLGLLNALAGTVAIAIDNAHLHAEVQKLAVTDGLTDLLNRRGFDQVLENEMARAARYDYPLALIVVDMDSFKELNDQRGHPAGDERLKAVAKLLRSSVRSPDAVARHGGEEFALILPYATKSSALALAERLRAAAETSAPDSLDHRSWIPGYTFSIGIAVFPEDASSVSELLLAADQAELTAKKLGKNRVCLADKRHER
jgi:diguanylate cyclase (GGDEF)-like protein